MTSFFSDNVIDITYKLLADFYVTANISSYFTLYYNVLLYNAAWTGAITRYYGFWNDHNFYVALYFSTNAGILIKDKLYLIMIPNVRIKIYEVSLVIY
jgi:hypothetical protein